MVLAAHQLAPRHNVFENARCEELYDRYAALRAAAPVCRGGPGTYVIPRYADVAALLRDERLGHHPPKLSDAAADVRAEFEPRPALKEVRDSAKPNAVLKRLIAGLDAPEHTRVRNLVRGALSPEFMESVAARIPGHVEALLELACERGTIDAVTDLALPLQMRVAADLLGIPDADKEEVAEQATSLGRAIILLPFVREEWGNGDDTATWLRAYVRRLLAERKASPGKDAISYLFSVRREGDALDEEEVIDNAVFLFFAGFETTVNLIASGTALFARWPKQFAALRSEPALVRSAIDEVLRMETPLQWVSRISKESIDVGGQSIRAGRVLLLLLGSANYDERQFASPTTFEVGRRPNPHLAFGGGAHHCMGRPLVLPEGSAFFTSLARRVRALEPAARAVYRPHPCIRGFASAPVHVTPA